MRPGSNEHSWLREPGKEGKAGYGVGYFLPVISATKSSQWPEVAWAAGGVMSGMHNKVLIHSQLMSQNTLERGLLFFLVKR